MIKILYDAQYVFFILNLLLVDYFMSDAWLINWSSKSI